jgi:hypothetical protein
MTTAFFEETGTQEQVETKAGLGFFEDVYIAELDTKSFPLLFILAPSRVSSQK